MVQANLTLRRWGNSIGVVIPQNILSLENAKEGDEVSVIIKKKRPNLKKLYGAYKFKQSTDDIMKEIDKELYDD
jgi:antitoxin component of MazEF toxin-antitoxin module